MPIRSLLLFCEKVFAQTLVFITLNKCIALIDMQNYHYLFFPIQVIHIY